MSSPQLPRERLSTRRHEPGFIPIVPLAAAVAHEHVDVAVWLLSHGADPNGNAVLRYGADCRPAALLQLLIDAGGDVNRKSFGRPPVFWATSAYCLDHVRVLLAHPGLNLAVRYEGRTIYQCARDRGEDALALADMVAQEVRGTCWRDVNALCRLVIEPCQVPVGCRRMLRAGRVAVKMCLW